MSPPPKQTEFVETVVALLKEYAQMLKGTIEAAIRIRREVSETRRAWWKPDKFKRKSIEAEYDALELIFTRIKPAAENLARTVSQRIEHGKLDDLEQVELQLRLAEFEGNLLAASHTVLSIRPQW